MDVSLPGYLALAVGGVLVGFSKTAIAGAATVAVVIFAMVLPTRESTGVLLVVLMVGDALAVWTYRRDADWALIRRLIVPVGLGLLIGAAFLAWASVALLTLVIGGIVVAMTLIQAWRMWQAARAARTARAAGSPPGPPAVGPSHAGHAGQVTGARAFGTLAGFTTMVANAGGPVMTLYLLRSQLEVTRFVGTLAWFFACVNLAKLPFSIGLGLVRPQGLALVLTLIPAVVVGAVIGRWVITRISRTVFEVTVLVVAGVSGVYLMLT